MQPEAITAPTCTVPPAGWQCSRPASHEGACAASPTTEAADSQQWAILEIMGHERLAGRVSDATLAGVPMLKVEVPAVGSLPGFTRLLSGPSIFSLTPVPEAAARVVASRLAKNPIGDQLWAYSLDDRLKLS